MPRYSRTAFGWLLVLLIAAALTSGCRPQAVAVQVTATPAPTSPPAAPPTLTVCATGCDFATIQAAIDDVNSVAGTTIAVTDAIHTEAGITIGKDVFIQGTGDTIIQAQADPGSATDRVFVIWEGATVNIKDLTIRHGYATLEPELPSGVRREGGGIVNFGTLTLENVTVRENVASGGGGIYNKNMLTLTNCTVSDNIADGIDPHIGHGCGSGAGIKSVEGLVTITGSAINGNTAAGRGGGIHIACASTVRLTNSTISGNSAVNVGGGIHLRGTLELSFSTITDNSTEQTGGGIYNRGTLHFSNTIVAHNSGGPECIIGANESGRMPGTIETNTNNLVEDSSCEAALSGDPMLGPLTDNGGSTLTHALLSGSPAVDAASDCPLTTDQRGTARPQGSACDLGALEAER